MAEKPTCADLEQTIKKLENEAVKRERMAGQLHQNFKYLIKLVDNYCPTRLAVVLRLLQLS